MAGLLDTSALAGSVGPTRNRPQGVDNLLGFISDPQSYKDMGKNLLDLVPNISVNYNPDIPIQQGLGQDRAGNETQLVKDAGSNALDLMKSPIQYTTDTMAGISGLAQELEAIVAGDPEAIKRAKGADASSPVANKAKPVTDTDSPKEAHNKKTYNQGLHDIVQAGGSEEELSAWDKLNEEFDMTTVGMALLASNDGSSNMAANIGKALMAGRQTVINKATTARANKIEDIETQVKVADAMSSRLRAIAANASASAGQAPVTPDKSEIADMTRALGRSGVLEKIHKDSKGTMIDSFASLYAFELARNPRQNRDALADRIVNTFGKDIIGPDQSTFGGMFGQEFGVPGL